MPTAHPTPAIVWRIHATAAPERVYSLLATDAGRALFWAASAKESPPGIIEFVFRSGDSCRSHVLESVPGRLFSLTYFGGSRVSFSLDSDGAGGTVVTVQETGVAEPEWLDNYAGWVAVLLSLKASVDFGVDLRNGDPGRSWSQRFVDV